VVPATSRLLDRRSGVGGFVEVGIEDEKRSPLFPRYPVAMIAGLDTRSSLFYVFVMPGAGPAASLYGRGPDRVLPKKFRDLLMRIRKRDRTGETQSRSVKSNGRRP